MAKQPDDAPPRETGGAQAQRGRGKGRPSTGARKPRSLRVASTDEPLIDMIRPYIAGVDTESDLIYHVWQPGLDIHLARLLSLGVALPPGYTEEAIALRLAQHLILCLPLLRRADVLEMIGLRADQDAAPLAVGTPVEAGNGAIDPQAATKIASMGSDDFI